MTDLGIEASLDPEIEEKERKKGRNNYEALFNRFCCTGHEPDEQRVGSFAEGQRVRQENQYYDIPAPRRGEDDTARRPVRVQATGFRHRPGCRLHLHGDETQLITTIIAIHTQRLQVTDKTEFSFYDSPAGEPTALRAWFYPGDDTGFLFRQAQQTAGTLAAAGKAPKRSYQHTAAAGSSAGGAD
jgi:hypothetical protein